MKVMICGSGEYTTGYVEENGSHHSAARDKRKGVVGLVIFDLKRRGFVSNIGICGVHGLKFPEIRKHLLRSIELEYKDMDTSFSCWPSEDTAYDPKAYIDAINSLHPGDCVAIYTPDDTHFDICLHAITRHLHCIIAKPAVKTVAQQLTLIKAARENGVLVMVEFHKRWDPVYLDAMQRIRALGDFSYWYSYMSQPKSQLRTFRKWVGGERSSSDISYYLNSHHIDFHCWSMRGVAVPIEVVAFASKGIAEKESLAENVEDTITLVTTWNNVSETSTSKTNVTGTAVYTASWVAPNNAEVHTQQRFTCLSSKGEIRVDQAHRGYESTTDSNSFSSHNPYYMNYSPDERGYFNGQLGYGYIPFEVWLKACKALNDKDTDLDKLNEWLPTIENTLMVTAILEAGRKSLDCGSSSIAINTTQKSYARMNDV